jgi:8-oxo-dGTP pyrophosphatase MutT (NUDIX family)
MTDVSPEALTARLDSETRTRTAPPLRPVDAATLILLDDRGRRPKVLMGRRSPNLKFMPGKFVFPGGRVDPADSQMLAAGALSPRAEMRLMSRAPRLTPARCRAIAMAAIRETFEETGLMIGTADHGPPERAPAGVWREFADQGLFPTPDALTYVARAITPPGRPRRFDTRFFVASLGNVGGRVEREIGPAAELTELVWIDVEAAATLDLPTITQVILVELKERLSAGLAVDAPIPFYLERRRKFLRELI